MGIFSSSKPDKVSKASKPERPSKPASLGGTTTSSTSASSQSASPQSQAVIRPVFLLVWPNALFKVHWAVFIPDASDPTCKRGKYYHVEGSLKDGFRFEIVRGWDISKSRRRPHSPIEIGAIPAELVVDIATNDKLVKEAVPRDRIDAFFASVQPPSQSLNSVSTSESAAVRGYSTTARSFI